MVPIKKNRRIEWGSLLIWRFTKKLLKTLKLIFYGEMKQTIT
jgi:hypothetical protein